MSALFQSHSQAGQDQWIHDLIVVPEQRFRGTFLDIGANHPISINNSFGLENIGWRGLLVDCDPQFSEPCRLHRKSHFLCADATTVDWTEVLDSSFFADYLSLDTDPVTDNALKNLLKHGVRFRAATIEHDRYRYGDGPRNEMRKMLLAEGYKLERADVKCEGYGEFEDWWIDPKTVGIKI